MMAAKVDNEAPEWARRTGRGGRGPQSRGKGVGPRGGPGTRRHGAAPAVRAGAAGCRRAYPALPSLQEALTAALHQRVAQRAAPDDGAHPPLVGYLCERCLDAPALLVQPAPW